MTASTQCSLLDALIIYTYIGYNSGSIKPYGQQCSRMTQPTFIQQSWSSNAGCFLLLVPAPLNHMACNEKHGVSNKNLSSESPACPIPGGWGAAGAPHDGFHQRIHALVKAYANLALDWSNQVDLRKQLDEMQLTVQGSGMHKQLGRCIYIIGWIKPYTSSNRFIECVQLGVDPLKIFPDYIYRFHDKTYIYIYRYKYISLYISSYPFCPRVRLALYPLCHVSLWSPCPFATVSFCHVFLLSPCAFVPVSLVSPCPFVSVALWSPCPFVLVSLLSPHPVVHVSSPYPFVTV